MALLRPHPHRRNTPNHSVWQVLVTGFSLCIFFRVLSPLALAQEIQAPEYKVKAAFLYNFTKLVDWPTNSFADSNAPLVIGVLGRDPFGKALDNVVAERSVNGRKLQIARFSLTEEITNCHVLFISEFERRKLDFILDALQGKPILTVGDTKGFDSRGMIMLVKSDETIDLRINLKAASSAGLQLSSRLTRLDKSLRPLGEGSTNAPPDNRK